MSAAPSDAVVRNALSYLSSKTILYGALGTSCRSVRELACRIVVEQTDEVPLTMLVDAASILTRQRRVSNTEALTFRNITCKKSSSTTLEENKVKISCAFARRDFTGLRFGVKRFAENNLDVFYHFVLAGEFFSGYVSYSPAHFPRLQHFFIDTSNWFHRRDSEPVLLWKLSMCPWIEQCNITEKLSIRLSGNSFLCLEELEDLFPWKRVSSVNVANIPSRRNAVHARVERICRQAFIHEIAESLRLWCLDNHDDDVGIVSSVSKSITITASAHHCRTVGAKMSDDALLLPKVTRKMFQQMPRIVSPGSWHTDILPLPPQVTDVAFAQYLRDVDRLDLPMPLLRHVLHDDEDDGDEHGLFDYYDLGTKTSSANIAYRCYHSARHLIDEFDSIDQVLQRFPPRCISFNVDVLYEEIQRLLDKVAGLDTAFVFSLWDMPIDVLRHILETTSASVHIHLFSGMDQLQGFFDALQGPYLSRVSVSCFTFSDYFGFSVEPYRSLEEFFEPFTRRPNDVRKLLYLLQSQSRIDPILTDLEKCGEFRKCRGSIMFDVCVAFYEYKGRKNLIARIQQMCDSVFGARTFVCHLQGLQNACSFLDIECHLASIRLFLQEW